MFTMRRVFMAIKDFLEFRDLKTEESNECQPELQVAKIATELNCLENNPEKLFAITYPSQLIKDLIEFVNSNMKNNKMRYRDNEETVVIHGNYATGKTHALLSIYNLFTNYDIAAEWLSKHKIKFNKFNAFAIKNKSKSCIVSLSEEVEEKIWPLIFARLGVENLLSNSQEPPSPKLLRKITKSENVAIFIDDIDQFFIQLQQQDKEEVINKNKEFLSNLLSEASKNDNLMVFASTLGLAKDFEAVLDSHDVIRKNTALSSQRNKYIFYHLFDEIKDQQFKTNIEPVLDSYTEVYTTAELEIYDAQEFRQNLIETYPFHADLLKILGTIFQNYYQEIDAYNNEINLLADLIEQYNTKDLLVVSDLPVEILKLSFPKLYNGLQAEMKRVNLENKDYLRRILNTIFIYTTLDNQAATRENILKAIIRPQLEYEVSDIKQSLDELSTQGKYVEFEEGIYRIKAKKRITTLLQEQKEGIANRKIENEIKTYITSYVFNKQYSFYSDGKWSDSPELEYLLLLEAPTAEEELQNFLEEDIYSDLTYENNLVFITPTQDILTKAVKELAGNIIAVENIIDQHQGEEKEKLSQQLAEHKQKLKEVLKESFGYYLKWINNKGQFDLQKVEINVNEIEDLENIIVNKEEIKDYIVEQEENVISVNKLFEASQTDRKMPIMPQREVLDAAIDDLVTNEDYILLPSQDKLYKSLSDLIAERVTDIDDIEARNKLMNHLRYDIFAPEYKIYGRDEITDKEELQYVVLLNDLIESDRLREFLEQEIYAGRKYQNALLILKSEGEIFSAENISEVKKEIGLEKLVKEWEQREKAIDLLEEKRADIINQLQELFGEFLLWTTSGEELILEKSTLDVVDFNIDHLIKTKIGFIKEAVINRINQLEASIKVEDLLLEFKKHRNNPVIDTDTFYDVINELAEEGRIHIDDDNQEIYSKFLSSVKEEMNNLKNYEVKRDLAYFVRDNLFNENYKLWSYEEVEDNYELEYLLVLDLPAEDIEDFLKQEIYSSLEYQNSVVILRAKEDIYIKEILDKVKKLKAIQNLEEDEVKANSKLTSDLQQELIALLEDKFAYYEQWTTVDDELKLEEKEVTVTNLDTELEVDLATLKEHLMANLRDRKLGINSKELFLDYRRFRDYPLILDKSLFDQAVKELIAKQKIINAEEENKVYGNTSALIKSTVNEVSNKEAKQELVLYIRNQLFNEEYNVFGYDQLEDSLAVKYLLLLGSFKDKDKLQQILEEKLYQDRKYKNNIILYSSREDVFKDKYVNKMKLVMGVQQAKEKINWNPSQIDRILDKRRQSLNQQLKQVFGNYLYWVEEKGKLKLASEELAAKLTTEELAAEIKPSREVLEEDIKERLKELEGITAQELYSYYKEFRDYPLLIDKQNFDQALKQLQEKEKVFKEEDQGSLHLSPFLRAEEQMDQFEIEEVKQKLAYFVRDNLFNEDYKVFKYDELKDTPELDYILLLDQPDEDLTNFLNQKIYRDFEFQNSMLVLRAKENIYTTEILKQTKKIMAVKESLQQSDNFNFSEDMILELKAELIEMLEDKFAYYERWVKNDSGLELKEEEVGLVKITEQIEAEFEELKNHLTAEIKNRSEVITKQELFFDYRRFRDYPLIINRDLFAQAIEDLISAGKIIVAAENDKIYSSLDDIIKFEANKIDTKEAKQELILYIRNQFFDEQYNVFGYDDLADNSEIKHLLLLGSYKNKAKLKQLLEEKLYQNREYENTIVLYSAQEDIFKERYIKKMKLLIAVRQIQNEAQDFAAETETIITEYKQELNQILAESFGNYLYWKQQGSELKLEQQDLKARLHPTDLAMEIQPSIENMKQDISQRLRELDGIEVSKLLGYYKKFRSYPVIINDQDFYQALEELEAEEKLFIEQENNTIHLNPILRAEERINEFETEAAQKKLAYFMRDNLFGKEYKVWGYDQLQDSPELKYVLLFETPEEDLAEFLVREIYSELEFENSIALFRIKNDIYTPEILKQTKKLMAVQAIQEENEIIKYPNKIISDLESKLLSLIAENQVYYQKWVENDEQDLQLKEEEIAVAELPEALAMDLDILKEDIRDKLRGKNLGTTKADLFADYRRFRGYPLVINREQFDQAIAELISEQKVITTEEGNKIYGSTSALIQNTLSEIKGKEAKQELVLYIRNQLFNQEYKVFGYDELESGAELKYLLLLGSFKNKAKLKQILEQNLYQNRKYENNIILYSSREDVFKEKYVNKMKLVMGVKRAQEKINWDKSKISRILDKRRQQLNKQLKEIFGDYLYWKKQEGQLKLEAVELETMLTRKELRAEIEFDLENLKEDITNRLKGLEGINSTELLDHYRKFRGYPVITDEEKFYQALEELKAEKRIVSEKDKLYSNLESLVEAKFNEISKEQAQESLVDYIKEELFSSEYKIYGYDELPDNDEFKKVILLNYFAEQEELEKYLLEEVYNGRKYKGSLAIITPKIDLSKHVKLVKKVLAIAEINSENELVTKLFKVTENKLLQKLKDSFAYYLKWKEQEGSLVLNRQELELTAIKEFLVTDKAELKSYIINQLTEKVRVDDLLNKIKSDLASPLVESKEIFYDVVRELFADDQILLMNQEQELYQEEIKEVTGDMFLVDPEFELWAENSTEQKADLEEKGKAASDVKATKSAAAEVAAGEEKENVEIDKVDSQQAAEQEDTELKEQDEESEEDNYEILDLFL